MATISSHICKKARRETYFFASLGVRRLHITIFLFGTLFCYTRVHTITLLVIFVVVVVVGANN